ncbi:MAG: NADH-quinone oxidoreductase subunit M [Burkholderia sp.]|nr:NADH-quinone oxidoreductase subunit M [Burkholderia sp.]
MHSSLILSAAIWLPIIFGFFLPVVSSDKTPNISRWIALIGSVLSFAVTIPLIVEFDSKSVSLQFVERLTWIEQFNISYYLGIDGISMWFVILTSLITVIIMIAAWDIINKNVTQYLSAFLILSGIIIGVFSSADGLLFYVFFEATLIPIYIIIGMWGGQNRVYAAFKFFLYTLTGSLLMLVALLYLYIKTNSFELSVWNNAKIPMTQQLLLFIAFFIAFAVKVPMWPVHTWLPDAHVEAPTGGSIILAAIMLKLGAYGFLRFSLPITPDASKYFAPVIIALSLVSIVYMGLVAMVQDDMKKLIAYSSIAHMGFVTLGFFIFSQLGIEGAIVQMISHGFVSSAMFLSIGLLYERIHSRQIADYGGVANVMPKFSAFVMLFSMANCGLPGTSGFVGEFMVILATVHYNFWIGLIAALTLILGAAYTLWMYKRVYFGAIVNNNVASLNDINYREFIMLMILATFTLFIGLYPKPFTNMMHVSIKNLLSCIAQSKLL